MTMGYTARRIKSRLPHAHETIVVYKQKSSRRTNVGVLPKTTIIGNRMTLMASSRVNPIQC